MPKTYNDIRREYLEFKDMFPDDTRDLTTFAKQQDEIEGKPERVQAYNDGILKQASAAIDRGFEFTRLPQAAGYMGKQAGTQFDELFDTNIAPTVEGVARDLPRGVVESALTMVPGLGWAGGLAKLAGYGSAALSGVAQTDSLLGGAISAGTLGLGNKLMLPEKLGGINVGGKAAGAVSKWLDRASPDINPATAMNPFSGAPGGVTRATLAQQTVPKVAGVATDAALATGLNEASRQGMLSVGPNRVGLLDEQRNPFTEENIAANVVGAIPFTPQMVSAFRNRPTLVPKQYNQLVEWVKVRGEMNKQYAEKGYGGYETGSGWEETQAANRKFGDIEAEQKPFGKEPAAQPFESRDRAMLADTLETQFENLDTAKQRNSPDEAEEIRTRIRSLMKGLSEQGELSASDLQSMAKELADGVTSSPAPDVKGLGKFIQDFNALANQWNAMYVRMQEEGWTLKETFKKGQPTIPGTGTLAGKGETWHPGARDAMVLERLQRQGLLQPITEDFLKKEYGATFNEHGDPQFAYEVVLQKVTNDLLDRTQAALDAEKQHGQKADVQISEMSEEARRRQEKQEMELAEYAASFESIPKEHLKGVLARAVKIASQAPARLHPFARKQFTSEPVWRKALVYAMQTFDPATNSVLLPMGKETVGGKKQMKYERVDIRYLYDTDEHGNYLWKPRTTSLSVLEGGVQKVSGEYVRNLEETEGRVGKRDFESEEMPTELLDEEEYKQKILEDTTLRGSLAAKEELGKVLPGEVVSGPKIPDEGTMPGFMEGQPKETTDVVLKAMKNLESLSDDQLGVLTRDAFAVKTTGLSRRDPSEGSRRARLKVAIRAAVENLGRSDALTDSGREFLRLSQEQGRTLPKGGEREQFRVLISDIFKNAAKVEGGKTGTYRDRVWQVLQTLADDAKVGKVREGVPDAANTWGAVDANFKSTFVNRPGTDPGKFTYDVYRTYRDYMYNKIGQQGVSGEMRELFTQLATAVAMQMEGAPVEFFKIHGPKGDSAGLAWRQQDRKGTGQEVGVVGVEFDQVMKSSKDPQQKMNYALEVLSHEIAHIDQRVLQGYIKAPDAFSAKRQVHLDNLYKIAEQMTDEERNLSLKVLANALLAPDEARKMFSLASPAKAYGSQLVSGSAKEYHAQIIGIITKSLLAGTDNTKRTKFDVFDYMPTEIEQYARGTYRTIASVLEAATDAMADKSIKALSLRQDKNPWVTAEVMNATVRAAIYGSRMSDTSLKLMENAKAYVATMGQNSAGHPPTTSTWFWNPPKNAVSPMLQGPDASRIDRAAAGVKAAAALFDPRVLDKAAQPGIWGKWFAPFSYLMESMDRAGVPLARPVMNLALGLDGRRTLRMTNMLAPFLTPDKSGGFKYDKSHALLERLSERGGKKGPWRQAYNDLSAWQQENSAQSIFTTDQNSQVVVNEGVKGAKEKWDQVKGRLNPADQQVVMAAMMSGDKIGQIVGVHLLEHIANSSVNRLAALFLAMNKGMTYDQALDMGKNTLSAWATGQEMGVRQLVQLPKQADQVVAYLGGSDGMFARYKEAEKVLLGRSGFRTESLPGDWIVQFKTPDGSTKFLSAETETKARWLQEKLVGEGNTILKPAVDKKSLKNFEDFDAPDVVLGKFTEIEGGTWEKVLERMRTTWGDDVVNDLKSYTPGATVMKEMEVRGIGKFLSERKSLVDRSRYDYLDGMISWVGKVASSIEYKETQQMKELILADPRGKNFPSFRELVDPHFENLMTPTSQLARELKTMVSGYFMGGSLASAVMNATQSLTTLVPTLIQYSKNGGPVEAWGMLGKAIAKATDLSMSNNWQKVAAEAVKKDPKTWTLEESQAYYYKRNIEEGGINQGVIQDDLFAGTDQRAILASKFGHGDYGPVDKADLIRNPLYVGAQLSLKPFGWVEHFNNKISLMSGLEQGYKNGLRGEQLYDHAKLVKVLSTFGGGKANAPGLVPKLSTPWTRSAVGVANTLQQYGYGVVSAYGQFVKDSLGRSSTLTPQQRWQSQKAFGTMLATQVALGGTLGLPFAGATLAVLEQVFGVPANQLVREGLASLSEDEETGAVITETALNGAANQLFGLDLSSRLGVSNLLGTSAYRGFNLTDLAGPVGGVIGNAVEGLSLFAQGQPEKAASAVVPAALRNTVELWGSRSKYGDDAMRDREGNVLYNPTTTEAAAYLAGFRPAVLSQKRQAQKIMRTADMLEGNEFDRSMDRAARDLAQGNNEPATTLVRDAKYVDPTVDPKALYRSIVRRSVDMQVEKDLLATGQRVSEASRQSIAGTFGAEVLPRQSEIERAQIAAQLGVQFGLKPEIREFRKAALVDMLVRQRGMPRSAALRLAEFVQ